MVRGGVRFWWPLWKIFTSVPQVEQFLTLSLISSGPHSGLGHLLQTDVLGGVEAQCLHRCSSRVVGVVRVPRSSHASPRNREEIHINGHESCPSAWQSCPIVRFTVRCDEAHANTRLVSGGSACPLTTARPRRCAGPRAEVRHVPVQHDHAEHRRDHRLGTDYGVLHPGRLDAEREDRHRGRPDDHLPAPDPDRLHRRQDGLRRPRWRRRRDGRHGRHSRDQRSRSSSATRAARRCSWAP